MLHRILTSIVLVLSVNGQQATAGGPSPTAQSGFRQTVHSLIASLFPTDEERVRTRYERAQNRAKAGDFNGAAHDYIWLWSNIPKLSPGYSGVRVSFMAGNMKDLAQAHPSCYRMFAALRDELTPRIAPGPDFDPVAQWDWIVLNCRVLIDAQTIAHWAETIDISETVKNDCCDTYGDVRNIIIDQGDWDLAAQLVSDPLEVAKADRRLYQGVRAESEDFLRYTNRKHDPESSYELGYRREFARLHTLALIRGLDEDARAIAVEAVAIQPADAMFVVMAETALSANQVRPMHLEWLNTCANPPADLRAEVEAALTNPAPPKTPPSTPAP